MIGVYYIILDEVLLVKHITISINITNTNIAVIRVISKSQYKVFCYNSLTF